ncbi:PQQ-like beta-propeller repeat protein [Halorussus halophilus]|uniref:PQQ-like beta-propeller repeat protein n=1 Tax=Halorussus halophilus TaxID=2650975 RepID=UPI00130149E6|nr:PQQ-like beta-propeller repeat protein [Halorussus halophilus]
MDRRTKLLSVFLTGLLLVSGATLGGAVMGAQPTAANASSDAWESDRADDGRTGATNAAGPSAEYAGTAWHSDALDGEPTGVSVADGTAYVGIEMKYDVAISKGKVAARDAKTGELKWSRNEIPKVAGTPAVAGDTVYVATEAYTAGGYEQRNDSIERGFYAFDADTGETKWKFTGAVDWDRGISPVVVGDTVYAISNDTVYALDAETGEKLRTISPPTEGGTTDDGVTTSRYVKGFAVADGTLYVEVGQSVTDYSTDEYDPEYSTDVVAYDAASGDKAWTTTMNGASEGMAATDSGVYVTLQPNTVVKFSTDGNQRWKQKVTADFQDSKSDWVSAPAVDNGTVYVATDDHSEEGDDERVGAVHALDAMSGAEDWQFQTSALLTTAPSVGEDSVYVSGDYPKQDGDYVEDNPQGATQTYMSRTVVYSLDRMDGAEQWSYATHDGTTEMDPFATAPVGDHVYVADEDQYSTDGNLYVLNGSETQPPVEHRLAPDEPRDRDYGPAFELKTTPKNAEDKALDGNSTVQLRVNSTNEETIESVEWDLDGDGDYEVTGKTAEVTMPACGSIEVTVRVTDDDGDTIVRDYEFSTLD